MNISPFLRQVFVASSPQLAAFTVGGITGFPTVLLHQLKANDSSIPMDLDTSSWIASVHGLAGIPCLLVSLIMQWKGRKLAFIISTLLIITGWAVMMIASTVVHILIAESFQGLGGNCIIIVSLLTVSEMVAPNFRPLSMVLFAILQSMGVVFITLIGYCLHWKTLSFVMLVPIVLALVMSCTWPESPSWLACKGEFEKCEKAFHWLRGDNIDAKNELAALLTAQKEALSTAKEEIKTINILRRIRRRDFYLPSIHIFVLLATFYWSGSLALYIYTVPLIQHTTGISNDFLPMAFTDSVMTIACLISIILIRRYKNKTLFVASGLGCTLSLIASSVIMFLQRCGVLPSTSFIAWFFMLVYTVFCTVGLTNLAFNMSAELMPVKHRGIGGVFYTVSMAVLYTSSIKAAPYLFIYIDYCGALLIYAKVNMLGTLFVWKYVPETKNRSLQEIEDYYNRGSFDICDTNVEEPILKGVE